MHHPGGLLRLLALGLLVALAGRAVAVEVEVVAAGLNNPRGLGFSPSGQLYVAEVGTGGTGACRPNPDGMPNEVCYGETGALTRVDPYGIQAPKRILSGLPSMALPDGFAATSGPVDVDFFGHTPFVVMAWGGDPALRAGIGPKSRLFGTVLRVLAPGVAVPVTDIAYNEQRFNPAGGTVDSNPYGILALPGRRIIADAGANAVVESTVLDWWRRGRDRTLAVLPTTSFGGQPVPTTVVQGPDGYLYVGQLTGAPFFRGSANIYRIPPHGGTPEVYLGGLTAIVDIAFAQDGTLYVVEIASGLVPGPGADPGVGNGRLKRRLPGGPVEVLVDNLVFPAGVAVGPDGAVYVTTFGIFPGAGQVLRITP
jgi:sugar lactone lactonase YvrE